MTIEEIKRNNSIYDTSMYVEYQPWITLIYIAIFISPLIAGIIIRFQ
jgi:hypothetical protein